MGCQGRCWLECWPSGLACSARCRGQPPTAAGPHALQCHSPVLQAASDAGAAVRYPGGATSCTQRGVGLYTAASATAWRFIPFQVP